MAFKNLKAELSRVGVSQIEVADMLGVTYACFNKWLNGNTKPDVVQALTIWRAYFESLEIDYLFEYSKSSN